MSERLYYGVTKARDWQHLVRMDDRLVASVPLEKLTAAPYCEGGIHEWEFLSEMLRINNLGRGSRSPGEPERWPPMCPSCLALWVSGRLDRMMEAAGGMGAP
jgi:hypothetical protein